MKEIEQSQTVTIKRSAIVFNQKNIKHHSQEQVKKQKDNIRKVGILGGIVWNDVTFNLIDGHKRIAALDSINKYDPNDPDTDYDVKVEKVSLDEKAEKEQMVFMSVANTAPDFNLIANVIEDIDYKAAGISDKDYKDILDLRPVDTTFEVEEVVLPKGYGKDEPEEPLRDNGGNIATTHVPVAEPVKEMSEEELLEDTPTQGNPVPEEEDEESAEAEIAREVGKINKEYTQDVAERRNSRLSLVGAIRFADEDEKVRFCEIFGIDYDFNITINAKDILELWENQQ